MRNVLSLSLGLAGEGGAAEEEFGGRGEGTRGVNSTSRPGVGQHSTHRELPKSLSLEMFIISSGLECLNTECDLHPSLSGHHRAQPTPDGVSSSTRSSRGTLSPPLPDTCPAAWDV